MESAVAAPTLGEVHRLPKSVLVIAGFSLLLLIFIYLFYPAFPTASGKTLAGWTWLACNSYNGFLHGRLALILTTTMLILAWRRNRNEPFAPSYWGLLSLTVGLLFFYAGAKAIQPRYALFGAPLVIIGLSHYLFGRKITKATLFPAFFLWFAIPIPGMVSFIAPHLEVYIFELVYYTLSLLGMEPSRQGSTLSFQGSQIESYHGWMGMRLFMFLLMSASIFANYSQTSLWKKLLLFSAAMPLIVLGNAGRIFVLLLFIYIGSEDFARKIYHDWAGLLIITPVTLIGLLLLSFLLKKTLRPSASSATPC